MQNMIYINDYIEFDVDTGHFSVTPKTREILYRQKQVIRSYSGCTEWGHKFFCELLDLYSGSSQYNYSLCTVIHVIQIEKMYRKGHKQEVIDWIKKHKNDEWFTKATVMFAKIIEDVPSYYKEDI